MIRRQEAAWKSSWRTQDITNRVAHWLYKGEMRLARMVAGFSRLLTGIEIHPGANDWKTILYHHGMGIVIKRQRLSVTMSNVPCGDLSGTGKDRQAPSNHRKWGALSAHSQVIGPVTAGEYAKIKYMVVLEDIPAHDLKAAGNEWSASIHQKRLKRYDYRRKLMWFKSTTLLNKTKRSI